MTTQRKLVGVEFLHTYVNINVITCKYSTFFATFVERLATYPNKSSMEMLQKESCIRGYHIYRELRHAVVGGELEWQRERGNATYMYALVLIKDSTIVGHLPRKISRICTLFY